MRPHARACRYDDHVVDARLHVPQPAPGLRGGVRIILRDGYELVEDPVVDQQSEEPGGGIAVGDEALGAGVRFMKPNVGAADDRAERRLVGVEFDAAVDDRFELRPDLADGRLAAEFEHPPKQHEQPTRHAADQRDRLGEAPLGQQFELAVPVRIRARGRAAGRCRARHGADSSIAAIPLRSPCRTPGAGFFELGRSAEEEQPPLEQPGIGPGRHVSRDHRLRRLAVRPDHRARNGDVLGGPQRRTAGQGQIGDAARPRRGFRTRGGAISGSRPRAPRRSASALRDWKSAIVAIEAKP